MMIRKIVGKNINEWDPVGLLALGAPNDEYEEEIKTIADLIVEVKNEEEFAINIKNTFDQIFAMNINFERCLPVANSIYKDIKSKVEKGF